MAGVKTTETTEVSEIMVKFNHSDGAHPHNSQSAVNFVRVSEIGLVAVPVRGEE